MKLGIQIADIFIRSVCEADSIKIILTLAFDEATIAVKSINATEILLMLSNVCKCAAVFGVWGSSICHRSRVLGASNVNAQQQLR
jgi:hypothetical protein